MQAANLCFAAGQVAYRRVAARLPKDLPAWRLFGWFFIAAWPVAALLFALLGDADKRPVTPVQWGVLLWLGLGASGLGYDVWNHGATKVDAGALAVMNNALIPAGLLVHVVFWNRDADLPRLAAGAGVIALSLLASEAWARRSPAIRPAR